MVSLPPRPSVVISASSTARRALALEPGHDDDLAGLQLGADAARLDAGDAGPAVAPVRRDPGLWPGQADGADAQAVERHRQQGRALVLAGREEDVQLARIRIVGDGGGQAEQLVGGVAHRGHDDDEVVAGGAFARDPPRDALDAVGVGHGRAAELLDDEGGRHGRGILPCASRRLGERQDSDSAVAPYDEGPSAAGEADPCASISTAVRRSRPSPVARSIRSVSC